MFDSVALAIQEFAKKTPDKTALIVGQEHCSYEKLAKKSRQAARFLLEKGIAAGDRIVVEADHTLDYVYLWYGIQLLGATFVPLEKNSPSARMIEIAQELDAKQIISLCERDDMPDFWALSRIMPAIDEMPDDYQASAPDPGSLSEILFTTGTTGKSKGVMVSYKNQMTIAQAGIETINIQTDNIWLIPTPMNHAAALRKVHIAMAVGSTTVLLEGFKNFKLFFKLYF